MARSLKTPVSPPVTAHRGKAFRQAVQLALLHCERQRITARPCVPLAMSVPLAMRAPLAKGSVGHERASLAVRRAPLAIVGQCKPDPDEYKEAPDAAIEPLFELIAGPEPAADSRRGPGDEQIPNRAIEIEDRSQD